ncbi:agamous-like MADS-box protein AGL80 [Ziziphus jujuba]|uniref:Agamous-like MADS-box protein AGL80 n=1 Tax=Ziziphus jujuba TaxID=326968 RepID=A0A6P4B965_ZIZJJ|nr:agamous-like MADS-box protein AGL80 [Ziziphus jujuba]
MTRKKVKLAYIKNDVARKATFKKRKKGLMKKLSELSILCGIETCTIICSPYEKKPEVWPSTMGVHKTLARFRKMPESDQSKNMMSQESYLRKNIEKMEEQLKKQHKENHEKEIEQMMYQSLAGDKLIKAMTNVELNELGKLVEKNIMEIGEKIESLKKIMRTPPPPPPPPQRLRTKLQILRARQHVN